MARKESQAWGRRAKAPKAGPWMKCSAGVKERNDAAKRAAAKGRALDARLDQELGDATYVDDLLEECGYGTD